MSSKPPPKKRRKKSSSLKNRILSERRRYAEKLVDESDARLGPVAVCIRNYVGRADMDDEDELVEILEDLTSLVAQFGAVDSIELASRVEPWTTFVGAGAGVDAETETHEDVIARAWEPVVVTFRATDVHPNPRRCCRLAVAAVGGLVLGGQELQAHLVDPTDGSTIADAGPSSLSSSSSLPDGSNTSTTGREVAVALEAAPSPLVRCRQPLKTPPASSGTGTWVVQVSHLLLRDETEDEEEVEEVMGDFYALCEQCECVPVGLWIEAGLTDGGSGSGSGGNVFSGVQTVAWGGVKRKDCLVVADMLDAAGAARAAARLQGLVLQGRALEVFACSADGSALADVKTLQPARGGGAVGGRGARLAIAGYLDSDELQEMQESRDRSGIVSDELVAVRQDLLSLIAHSAAEEGKEAGGVCSNTNKERAGVCRSLRFYAGTAAMAAAHKTPLGAGDGGDGEVLHVAFSRLVDAQRAMVWIDDSTIGGSAVSCALGELAPSEWTDPAVVGRRRHVMESRAAREESERVLQLSLSVLAPSPSRPPRRTWTSSGPARLPKANALPPGPGPDTDTDTDAGTGMKSTSAGMTDNVCRSDEEMDVLTKALLMALARFQSNALEKDAVKAKGDPRFVMGLKQCTNGVKSGRARLVLLASDPEASEALDAKIGTLLLQAANKLDKDDEPVPVLVSLSRRQLGKAVQSKMRQAAVAIYKPDGAYAEFKKLVAYIRAHNERATSSSKS